MHLLNQSDPDDYLVYCNEVLNQMEQQELMKEIELIYQNGPPLYQNKTGQGGYKQTSKYLQLFNLHLSDCKLESNCSNQKMTLANVPDVFLKSTLNCIKYAATVNQRIKVSMYKPGWCEFILYEKDGFVEEHCDCINGWVIVISLGLSANFWWKDKNGEKRSTIVRSGDAIVFNGSAVINLRHGVDQIISDTFPKDLLGDCLSNAFQDKRIILQIHQELKL